MPTPDGDDRLQVLIVDDYRDTARAIALVCRLKGLTAVATNSIDEALPFLPLRPRFLFTDHVLPGPQTGLDLIALVRERVPDCRSFLMTALPPGSVDDEAAALGVPPGAILHKPLQSKDVLDRVLVDPAAPVPEPKP